MVRPSIVVFTKGHQSQGFQSLFLADKIPASLDAAMQTEGVHADADALKQPEWNFQARSVSGLFRRLVATGIPLRSYVEAPLLRGILTGLNEAFVIDQVTRDGLIALDHQAIDLIHPLVTGQDLRPWYKEEEGRHIIIIPAGWSKSNFGQGLSEDDAWAELGRRYPSIAGHLKRFADGARKRGDKGDYWWELRPCDYYGAFETSKIMFPDIAKLPRCSLDSSGTYMNNTGYFIPGADAYLLGILQSRIIWFAISQISQPLRLRAGLWQYRLFPQFVERLPVPNAPTAEREEIASLAQAISDLARLRYGLHNRVRKRISSDLGGTGFSLNQKLTAWWTLDFPAFRVEVQKALRREIPVRERDEWAAWLEERQGEHERLTGEIVRLETELNSRVYVLFDLSAEETEIIEESTKYKYGEV